MKRQRDEAAASDAAAADAPPSAEAPAGASSAEPAPDSASLLAAQFWYYEGAESVQHGPFSSADMRAWFTGGYLQPTLAVAPSWYGEVPITFWPISALWADDVAGEQAFVGVALAPVAVAPLLSAAPEFIESDTFDGAKDGYAFRTDFYGTGYYRDTPPPIEITADDIEAEKRERKAKALAFVSHIAPTGADFREHKG